MVSGGTYWKFARASDVVTTCFRNYVQGVQLLSTAYSRTVILLHALKT